MATAKNNNSNQGPQQDPQVTVNQQTGGSMMKKYELLKDEKIVIDDHELFRIKAVRDFSGVKAGELGGYIESERNLTQDGYCWITTDTKVYGNAIVAGNAIIRNSEICDNAVVAENATVDSCCLYDTATIGGRAFSYKTDLHGSSSIVDNARVYESTLSGGASIGGYAKVTKSKLSDYSAVSGNANLDECTVSGCAVVNGDSHFVLADIDNLMAQGKFIKFKGVSVDYSRQPIGVSIMRA